jgi:hypothetical protein
MRTTVTPKQSSAEELCLIIDKEDREFCRQSGFPDNSQFNLNPLAKVNLEPNDFRALLRPGVYIFWKKDRALYVGKGRRVMNRMSNPNHGAVGRAIRECTSIEVLFFADERAAMAQESELIAHLQPLFNRKGLGSVMRGPGE